MRNDPNEDPADWGVLRAVLDAARAPLALTDVHGRLLHLNAAFAAGWSARQGPVRGRPIRDLVEEIPGPGPTDPAGPFAVPPVWQVRGGRARGTTTLLNASGGALLLLELSAAEDRPAEVADAAAVRRAADVREVVLALSESLTVAEVSAVMVGQVGAALGSAGVLLALLDDEGVLSPLEVGGYGAEMLTLINSRLRDPGGAPMSAVHERRPAVFATPADYLARFPGRADLVHASGMQSWVFLPLIASGRVIGTWTVSYAEQHATEPAELALLVTLAALCAQSLERARLYEREHETSRVLQRAIAPDELPDLPGVLLAAGYAPATADNQVGGDFYDVRPLPDGRVLLVLGDVSGHDIAAAALMGQVRATLRAYAAEDRGPASLLRSTNRLLSGRTGRLVTCCCVDLDPASGVGRVALAGHPPPVLISRRGGARLLEDARGGPPLAAMADAEYDQTAVLLEPGDLLLLYTDGLVESKELTLDDGLAQLVAEAAAAPRTPRGLVDHVVEALRPARPRDDIAVLALQRLPAAAARSYRR